MSEFTAICPVFNLKCVPSLIVVILVDITIVVIVVVVVIIVVAVVIEEGNEVIVGIDAKIA